MIVIACYDVSTVNKEGQRRLRKVAEACKDYGVRVQYSVFEFRIEEREWVALKGRLLEIVKPATDSLRFYFLCEECARKTQHYGQREPVDPTGPLVV